MRSADKDTGSRELRPDEIRQVLGQNLRKLLEREDSVVSFCQKIDLNRTQFNRYISGEAHPRPDVLAKICRYFDVDARMLLQPLEALQAKPVDRVRPDLDYLVKAILLKSTGLLGPDDGFTGMYRMWRRAFSDPSAMVTGLLQIAPKSGVMVIRFFEPNSASVKFPDRRDLPKKDYYSGVCMKTEGGVAAITHRTFASPSELIFGMIVIDRAEAPFPGVFRGVFTVARQKTFFSGRTCGLALERLPNDFASWREVGREPRIQPFSAAPATIRRIIDYIPPEM